jgi:hypothetical protein
MFTRVTRWSINNQEAASKSFAQGTAVWARAGAISMQRYEIVDGTHEGQHMVVVRFHNADDYEKAFVKAEAEIAAIRAELEADGNKQEDMMLLEEVVVPAAGATAPTAA